MAARFVYGVVALLTVTAGYACWCHLPLIWDGAYQFNATLIMQRPYFFLTRFHTFFLWWPTVWASRLTSNMTVLQSVYGLPFLLAPALNVLLCWWMVRKDAPHLILWSIFGVCAGSLPGQVFVINDSIFQQHLFWPIFLGMFVPLSKPQKIAIGVLTVFQFCHQLGTVLFFGAAVAVFVVATVDTDRRKAMWVRFGVLAGLFLLAVAKIVITNHIPSLCDSYAAEEAKWATAQQRWRDGVRGFPNIGLILMWIAAICAFKHRQYASARAARPSNPGGHGFGGVSGASMPKASSVALIEAMPQTTAVVNDQALAIRYAALSLGCVGLAALVWIYWAADGHLWWKALDYRRWVGPLTAPFFGLAAVEAYLSAKNHATPGVDFKPKTARLREPLALLLGVTFALVLGIQSHVWQQWTHRLMDAVWSYPSVVVPESAVSYFSADGPLDHWASADYVVAIQGKTPTKVLLDPRAERLIYGWSDTTPPQRIAPTIPHADMYPDPANPTPGRQGWFNFRPLLEKLATDPQASLRGGPVRLDIKTTPN